MIVAARKLDLHLPAVHSLKEKRHILKKISSRTQSRFAVAISEVGAQDLWQRTELGLCAVGSDAAQLSALLDRVIRFIDDMHLGEIISEQAESYQI